MSRLSLTPWTGLGWKSARLASVVPEIVAVLLLLLVLSLIVAVLIAPLAEWGE